MSETRLRAVAFQLFTIQEVAQILGTNPSRIWLWRHGGNVLTPEQAEIIQDRFVRKLSFLAQSCVGVEVVPCGLR